MKRKFLSLLFAIAFGITTLALIVAIIINHEAKLFVEIALMAGLCLYSLRLYRTPASSIWQAHKLTKVSNALYALCGIGAMVSILSAAFHVGHMVRPTANVSIVLFIAGALVSIFTPLKSNNNIINATYVRRAVILRNTLYFGGLCIVTGISLRINHYAAGKLLIYGGSAFLVVFLLFWEGYRQYIRKKKAP